MLVGQNLVVIYPSMIPLFPLTILSVAMGTIVWRRGGIDPLAKLAPRQERPIVFPERAMASGVVLLKAVDRREGFLADIGGTARKGSA